MPDPSQALAQLLHRDRRYKVGAYEFLQNAMSYAHEGLGMGHEAVSSQESPPADADPEAPPPPDKHLTGQELCEAIRVLGLKEYGYMAKSVFNSWGVHETRDFGNIVFNLIEIGYWKKTEQDRIEDFDEVFDFDAALVRDFSIGPPESAHG